MVTFEYKYLFLFRDYIYRRKYKIQHVTGNMIMSPSQEADSFTDAYEKEMKYI